MTKTAIVTGASAGIGEATALALQAKGFTVYAVARRAERMTHLAERGIVPVSADVTDDASLVALVDRVIAETDRVDVLVNNAGYGSYGALEEVPLDEARRQFDVNVFGLARLTQLVLPHMRQQGAGRIINVSSVGGRIWEPLGAWYHATKFAVEGLSDSLRAELRPHGIDVVVIQPGAIRTEWAAISAENLSAASTIPAYADQVRVGAAVLKKADEVKAASPPETVARTIVKAATTRRPRTRYATGGGARSVLLLNKLLTDRGWDRAITTAYKSQAGAADEQELTRARRRLLHALVLPLSEEIPPCAVVPPCSPWSPPRPRPCPTRPSPRRPRASPPPASRPSTECA